MMWYSLWMKSLEAQVFFVNRWSSVLHPSRHKWHNCIRCITSQTNMDRKSNSIPFSLHSSWTVAEALVSVCTRIFYVCWQPQLLKWCIKVCVLGDWSHENNKKAIHLHAVLLSFFPWYWSGKRNFTRESMSSDILAKLRLGEKANINGFIHPCIPGVTPRKIG